MGFTMAEKKKIAAEYASRYRKAGKGEKSRILDEYLALSGSKSRKYAIFKLNRIGKTQLRLPDGQAVTVVIVEKSRKKRVYQLSYDTPVAAMLELLWKNFDHDRCQNRLGHPFRPPEQGFNLGPQGPGPGFFRSSHGAEGRPFRHRQRINRPVDLWCQRHRVAFSRGRPTHKNGNCYVEQKNYATVRKIIGYFRYQGAAGIAALQAVYDAYNPLLNLYYPCMKQIKCERVGAKKKRTYDQGKTPFQRLLEQPFEDRLEERRVKMAALALKDATDLVGQKQMMDRAVDSLLACAHDVPMLPRRGTGGHG
jgi:hypothetical protein